MGRYIGLGCATGIAAALLFALLDIWSGHTPVVVAEQSVILGLLAGVFGGLLAYASARLAERDAEQPTD